jgi:23S rRNA (adenine2503-C2)-methyltransferase
MQDPTLHASAPADKDSDHGLEIVDVVGRPDLAEVLIGRFSDGRCVEFVDAVDPNLPKSKKWIINLSTQFGCPVRCPFCDAGGGYRGDASAAQLMAQVRAVLDRNPPGLNRTCRKLKVHFSRMGEPALNDAVLPALEQLRTDLPQTGVWACVATVAPRGRDDWFERLARLKERFFPGRFQLQFSLNSTDPETRQHLAPIPHWDFQTIADYGSRFFKAGDRKVVLNFALGRRVPFDPAVISERFDPRRFAVKLTPINPTETGAQNGFETVLRGELQPTLKPSLAALNRAGFDVVVSVGDAGEDEIGSNCGQALKALAPC